MIMQFQTYQQQSQMITGQKDIMKAQIIELGNCLTELEKSGNREIFKSVGPMLIKTSKEEMQKDLKEKKESMEVRLKSMDSEDNKLKEKVKELQEKIQESMKKEK